MVRAGRWALVLVPLVWIAACERAKSANPLSPSVAGPIAGVSIVAPKPAAPADASQIAVAQQPVTLTVENASSTGVRPLSYVFEVGAEATFATKLFSQTGVQAGTDGKTSLRLPQPLPGTGAIAEYAELGNFGMRVVMSYQPNTLAQQFTVDVLYGCGVLRNAAGVQVNT